MFTLPIGSPCYLLTHREVLMPGTVNAIESNGLVAVVSPQGKIYSCNPNNVFDKQTGAIMLMHKRAERMAQDGYLIAVRLDWSFRVYQPKKHGQTGGWVVTRQGDSLTCNCPAHDKEQTCKHVMAVCSLLLKRVQRLRNAGKNRVATRYENEAHRICFNH